jgi:hypothetical protein
VLKVRLGVHLLAEEAKYWWDNTRQRLEVAGSVLTWNVFRNMFLEKYFPGDATSKKEMDFRALTMQINLKSCLSSAHIIMLLGAWVSMCVEFESRLRPKIRQFIGDQEIMNFHVG